MDNDDDEETSVILRRNKGQKKTQGGRHIEKAPKGGSFKIYKILAL